MTGIAERSASWLSTTRLVLNRVSERSLAGAERYLGEEYGLEVAASLLDTPEYWKRVELEHSARALSVANPDHPRYLSAHGEQALKARKSIEALIILTMVWFFSIKCIQQIFTLTNNPTVMRQILE